MSCADYRISPRAYAARMLSLSDRALLINGASMLRGKETQRARHRRGAVRTLSGQEERLTQGDAVRRARKLTRLTDCTYCRRSRSTSYLSRSRNHRLVRARMRPSDDVLCAPAS